MQDTQTPCNLTEMYVALINVYALGEKVICVAMGTTSADAMMRMRQDAIFMMQEFWMQCIELFP